MARPWKYVLSVGIGGVRCGLCCICHVHWCSCCVLRVRVFVCMLSAVALMWMCCFSVFHMSGWCVEFGAKVVLVGAWGRASQVCFRGCSMFVCVALVWPWPVRCGGSLGKVVAC